MIQIYDLNAIQDQEIFLRRDEVRDVSAPVADIIRTVRAEGDRGSFLWPGWGSMSQAVPPPIRPPY